jgi:hypothetical protein
VGDYGTEEGKGEGKEKKEKEKESGKEWSLLFRCEVRISSKCTESFNSMDGSIGLTDAQKGGSRGVLLIEIYCCLMRS